MTRPHPCGVLVALAAGLILWPQAGQAGQAEAMVLQVAPLHSRTASGPCPSTLSFSETLQPYREGSYGITGQAALGALASGWQLVNRDAFSATWVGQLSAAYNSCTASAGIARADNRPHREHSYLRLRFSGGRVQLILDMTGMRDPNNFTPMIMSAGVSQGLPVWSWGGSD